jgi:acyl-CoA thioesterase-2
MCIVNFRLLQELRTKMPDSGNATRELLDLIRLEQLEVNLFRGASRDIGTSRVFGGQVLAQSVHAASMTVENCMIHSMHAYFLRAGDHEAPIVYNVDRSRDGRSFSARRVVAIQHGRPIFTMAASFHADEEGLEHQFEIPDVPGPDDIGPPHVMTEEQLRNIPVDLQRWYNRWGPFEFRPVQNLDPNNPVPQPPFKQVWFRLADRIDENQVMHRSLLAYASDFHLVGTATLPHGLSYVSGNLMMASLDHAMWFHLPVQVDDWLLYVCDSPRMGGGRGLARGSIYNQAGELVASTAQEGVIRVRESGSPK